MLPCAYLQERIDLTRKTHRIRSEKFMKTTPLTNS